MDHAPLADLLVVCLCAEWCGTCREYRPGFESLAHRWPDAEFRWVDIEAEADRIGDVEVENFPTLVIQRGDVVLFFGPMLPHHGHLQRLLETLAPLAESEARTYAAATPERRAWQAVGEIGAALRGRAAEGGR